MIERDEPVNISNDARIQCSSPPKEHTHCGGEGYKPCLFDIIKDPCEHNDVSDENPVVYEMMLKKLNQYRNTMIPPRENDTFDPEADPKRHNGEWISWRSLKQSYVEEYLNFIDVDTSLTFIWKYLFP